MSKKKFIKERLETLEDINSYYKKIKSGSTGEYGLADLTDNLLPILKDLIEENIELERKFKEHKDSLKQYQRGRCILK